MNRKQKHTPKYWVAHDPREKGIYLDTASKLKDDCQDKTIALFTNKRAFFDAVDEGKIDIHLMEIKPFGWPDHRPLRPSDFKKIVPKPYLRLKATKDYIMNDGSVAFKKGRAYLFAYTGRDSYVTVSEENNHEHELWEDDLIEYFELLK